MAGKRNYVAWIVSMLYIGASFGLAVAFQCMPDGFSILGIGPCIGEEDVSDYLTILSVHFTTVFLTTGLMSMLGAKEEMVYHVDIVQRTLLQPLGCNFRDLSIYAFVTLAMAVAAFAYRSAYVVLISAFVGTVAISWMFFKMIGIYFGKDRWQEKIEKEIKAANDDSYREALQQLYGILGRNLEEHDVEPLARNLALLIGLKACCRDEKNGWRGHAAGCMLDEVMERNGAQGGIPVLELYVRILGIFTKEKKREKEEKMKCLAALNSFFMDYAAAHKDILADWRKNAVLRTVFGFNESNPGIQGWIENLRQQIRDLGEDDFKASDEDGRESRFVELTKEVCQARLLATFHDMRVHYYDPVNGCALFYAEIEDLVRCDDERAGSGSFKYPTGLPCDENEGEVVYSWEYYTEQEMRDALFVRWFPRYAAEYGGDGTGSLLEGFFDAYREHARGGGRRMEYTFEPYSIFPQNPAVYDRMRICFLQGCAEQIMKGVPGIADTVAGMVAHFWEEAQYYKSSAELPGFYRSSFGHIGDSLLYADDSLAGRGYNERPECMLRFMELLVKRIKSSDVLDIDIEATFGGFVDTLQRLCPRYYSEESVREVERLVGQC